jgi:hypothetical protein
MKFRQNLLKQKVINFMLRSKNILILFEIRTNCHSSEMESITVPIYKKGYETNCINCRGISLLPTTHKILSSNKENCIHEEIKRRLNYRNACYHFVQNFLSSRFLSKNLRIKIMKTNFTRCYVWVGNLVS